MINKTKKIALVITFLFLLVHVETARTEETKTIPPTRASTSRVHTGSSTQPKSSTKSSAIKHYGYYYEDEEEGDEYFSSSGISRQRPSVRPAATPSRTTRYSRSSPSGRRSNMSAASTAIIRPTTSRTASRSPTLEKRPSYQYFPDASVIASGVVKIFCDPEVLELNESVLEALLNSSFVLPPEVGPHIMIRVLALGGSPQSPLYRLEVLDLSEELDFPSPYPSPEAPHQESEKPEPKANPGKIDPANFIETIIIRLQDILSVEHKKTHQYFRDRLELAHQELKPLDNELDRLTAEEQAMISHAGQSNLYRQDVLSLMQQHERRQQDLEMRLAEDSAHQEALQKHIALISHRTEDRIAKDSVTSELKAILDIRREEMDRVRQLVKQGQASQSELAAAQEAIARARIDFQKRREALTEIHGGKSLSDLNNELASIAMRNSEYEATRKFVLEQMDRLQAKNLLELANRYEVEILLKMESVREAFITVQYRINELKTLLAGMQPPSVSLLGGQ